MAVPRFGLCAQSLEGHSPLSRIRSLSIAVLLAALVLATFRPALPVSTGQAESAVIAAPPSTATPTASGAGAAAITLRTVDPDNPQLLYRVVSTASGQSVEQSSDGGRQWTVVLTPRHR